jgi:biopolymer transport protein ExbD
MAFSMNGGQIGGRRGFRSTGTGALAEINIVPLVDVVLVLLIIFMVTAHVMEFGMEVDVPKTKTRQDTAEVLPVVNISRDAQIFLIDKPVNINLLGQAIAQKFGTVKGAYVRADKEVPWEKLAQVISALHDAKIPVRLVTQPEEMTGTRNR